EALEGRGDGRRPVLAASGIELDDESLDAERADLTRGLLEAPGQRRGRGLPDGRGVLQALGARHRARRENEVEAAPGELESTAAPDPAARAGDEGDPALAHAAGPNAHGVARSTAARRLLHPESHLGRPPPLPGGDFPGLPGGTRPACGSRPGAPAFVAFRGPGVPRALPES